MIAAALLALAIVQNAPAPAIVVQGRRAERALAECRQRGCPPEEEIEAALDASVEQFVAGRYGDARANLRGQISRHRRHADEFPDLFASLLATYADVAEHEGDEADQYRVSFERNRLLRRHRGVGDPASIVGNMETADMLVTQGRPAQAEQVYRQVQRDAEAAGEQRLAGLVGIRRASLAFGMRNWPRADDRLRSAVAAAPGDELIATLARIIRARAAATRGDRGAVDTLVAELRQTPTTAPTLVYAPVLDVAGAPAAGLTGQNFSSGRWVDVGFWIRPDGSTAESDVLRADDDRGRWAAPILRHVDERRYAPLALTPDHPGLYRVERYTLRARRGTVTESRIPRRVGQASVRMLDLTHVDGHEQEVEIN